MIRNSTETEMSVEVPPLRHANRNQFLLAHRAGSGANDEKTHTRMPNKGCNNPEDKGGKFLIEEEIEAEFYHHYFTEVVQNGKLDYLTEKQLGEGGPVAVDLDFRFVPEIRVRQHNAEDIQDIISIYLEVLKTMLTFVSTKSFMVYVFEKPNVNTDSDEVTKDGIHLIFGIQMSSLLQTILRDKVLEQFESNPTNIEIIAELPLKPSCGWKDVLDEGISKGGTNWTLYGSRKASNEAYGITAAYQVRLDDTDGEFCTDDTGSEIYHRDIEEFKKLSVRYRNHPKFELTPEATRLLETKQRGKRGGRDMNRVVSNGRLNIIPRANAGPRTTEPSVPKCLITTKAQLEEWQSFLEHVLDQSSRFAIARDTHRYALTLPEMFYGDGSYTMWIELAFALKNTDDDLLFITWALVSAKKTGFDYGSIPDIYNKYWSPIQPREGGKTDRSVRYWSEAHNIDEFIKVQTTSAQYHLCKAVENGSDTEVCKLLYCLCGEQFVCSTLTSTAQAWYEFSNHRWEPDVGLRLQKDGIGCQLYDALYSAQGKFVADMAALREPNDDKRNNTYDKIGVQAANCGKVMLKCHDFNLKAKLAKEAAQHFFSKDFNANLDQNKWTLAFSNGVINLQTGEFRDGRPLDYISKSTNVSYLSESDMANDENQLILAEINTFMSELFPDEELCEYMWEHLASTLVGANLSQTFNIYKGGGSNGKSLLAILMSLALGEYCMPSAPIGIITSGRQKLGGATSEIYALKGIRYAIFQEPTKGMVLNEGAMKEMTGDAKISARELFQTQSVFNQMFSLAVCTNSLFEIKSNDEGTWRRLRIIWFKSRFLDADVYDALPENERNSKYIHKKVPELESTKLEVWAPVFASLLVRRCIKNQGIVKDCDMVLNETNKYRLRQNLIGQFVDEKIRACEGRTITRQALSQTWKMWLEETQSSNAPKMSELCEYLTSNYEKHGSAGWAGVEIVYEPPPDNDAF